MDILWLAIAIVVLLFGFVVFFGAPYVPTKHRELERAFEELYQLGDHDSLVDIGSGDGVVLRAAAQRGAKAVGYELNPVLVVLSRFLCRRYLSIRVYLANFWQVHFPADTTVVYVFGVTRDIEKIARKVQQEANRLRRPLSLISYGARIPHMVALQSLAAHHLYTFTPLQTK